MTLPLSHQAPLNGNKNEIAVLAKAGIYAAGGRNVARWILAFAKMMAVCLLLTSPAQAVMVRNDGAVQLYQPKLPLSAQNPQPSPDGKKVLFTTYYNGYNKAPGALFMLEVSSGTYQSFYGAIAPEAVSQKEDVHSNVSGGAWDKTTGQIAVSFASNETGTHILKIDPNSRNVTEIARNKTYFEHLYYPSFSPDGQKLLYTLYHSTSNSGTWRANVCILDLFKISAGVTIDSKSAKCFPNEQYGLEYDDRYANWSPFGDYIAFQRRWLEEANFHIYVISADGGVAKPLTSGQGNNTTPSFSPDGRWVVYAYAANSSSESKIFMVKTTGGAMRQITKTEGFWDSSPAFSPDGRWIYFESRNRDEGSAGLWRIAVPELF